MAITIKQLFGLTLAFTLVSSGRSASKIIILNEDNWDEMLTGEWMVEFYAPWCPACQSVQSVWENFSGWSKDLEFKVGQVDVTTAPGLTGRFLVGALPTIYHVLNGEFRQYKGSRDLETFITFIEDKKWSKIDPIPGWKSPSSLLMTLCSYFYKLSHYLRILHNKLMDEYGLPSWSSYLLFALGTILLGALLGLILVCFIDYIYPPHASARVPIEEMEKQQLLEDSEEDLADENDEIEEDGEVDEDAENEGDEGEDDEQEKDSDTKGSPNVRKRTRKAD